MDSCDPESEALIWKLHRELNGLTRSTRRGKSEFVSLEDTRKETRREPPSRSRAKAANTIQQEPGTSSKRKKDANYDNDDAPTASKAAKTTTADEPSGRSLNPRSEDAQPAPPSKQAQQVTSRHPQQDSLNKAGPSSDPTPSAPVASTYPSPLIAAAVAAGQLVRDRAKRAGATDTGQRHIKCFHAGVRWGVSLKASDIQSRADLATALNDALAGEILSCGRGDNLHIIFLDNTGSLCEFPSLRSAGTSAKESLQKWQAAVSTAVKVYVRRQP